MLNFPTDQYKAFADLPLEKFNKLKFSIYILDFNWNYLFVNDFVQENLGEKGQNLVGKNMWSTFEELAADPVFQKMRSNMDQHIVTNIVTTSPLNFKRINIIGYPLEDCFYFSVTILPNKDSLMKEIRQELVRTTR